MSPPEGRTTSALVDCTASETRTFGSIRVGRYSGYRSASWPTVIDPQVVLSYCRHAVEANASSDPDAVMTVVFDGEPHEEHTVVLKAAEVDEIEGSRGRDCRYVQADLERSYFAWIRHDERDGDRQAEMMYVIDDSESDRYVQLLLLATLPDQSDCIANAMAFLRQDQLPSS